VNNALRVLEVQGEYGSFDSYVWQFVDGAPIVGRRRPPSRKRPWWTSGVGSRRPVTLTAPAQPFLNGFLTAASPPPGASAPRASAPRGG